MINFKIIFIEDHFLSKSNSLNEIIKYIKDYDVEIVYIKKNKNIRSTYVDNRLSLLINMIINNTNLSRLYKLFNNREVGEIIKIL